MARSDRYTQRTAIDEIRSDISLDFIRNPITGNLAKLTNEKAVAQALRNIVLSQVEEWPHQPNLGSLIYKMLFEPMDTITAGMMQEAIQQAIVRNEFGARVIRVSVLPDWSGNGYDIQLYFTLVNSTEVHSVSTFLKRLR